MSYYLDNIPKEAVECQAKVFDKLRIPLIQKKYKYYPDPPWKCFYECILDIDKWISEQKELMILFDIDAIPLSKMFLVEYFIPFIEKGYLIGPAQRTVAPEFHEIHPLVYAGPAMLGFSAETYKKLKKPTLFCTDKTDVGGLFTIRAMENNVPIKLLRPTSCEQLLWKLEGPNLEFGLGTTFDNSLYHAFESRNGVERFIKKCNEIIAQ